jgi:hypothetical protein
VKDIEGQQIDKRFRKKNYIGISPSYFNVAVEGMRMSVTDGTSRIADIPGMRFVERQELHRTLQEQRRITLFCCICSKR